MTDQDSERYERFVDEQDDQRRRSERDRDRVLHCSALRRLAGVTQVVDPAEGYVFHNRLTHTLKVAQIARRLAQKLVADQTELAKALGGIDPEVVETAALAHDLGHPPFGHIAEVELDKLVRQCDLDGFEGNAQSFRIVTKLAIRRPNTRGLNLTRASLDALLKYPWFRNASHRKKWGAYRTEEKEFEWARSLHDEGVETRSTEAEIMDWSDDIAYSVHDLEDFYRARLIPLDRLARYEHERDKFFLAVVPRIKDHSQGKQYSLENLREVFERLMKLIPIEESYTGTRDQRAHLRLTTAMLIRRYLFGIELREPSADDPRTVSIQQKFEMETFMLKQLTWHFVIANPALASQQYGKAKVIRELFEIFQDAAGSKDWFDILPVRCREDLEELKDSSSAGSILRLIADVIASLSDAEALTIHRRLVGARPGSVLESLAH